MKLNLGAGNIHKKGYYNVDIIEPADVICRIGKEALPFEDNSVDLVEADNLMEHLDNDEFLFAMNDMWRVLHNEGDFWMKVPDSLRWWNGAAADPTHKRFFVDKSFYYFTDTPTYHNYGKSYGFKMWKQEFLETDNKFFVWIGKPAK